MGRRCDRPGCPGEAVVALGFDATRQMMWVVPVGEPIERFAGELCARHAERIVPPRGWWLDDRRKALTLFEEPAPPPAAAPAPEPVADAGSLPPEVAPPVVGDAPGATAPPAPAPATEATAPATTVPAGKPRNRAERRRAAREGSRGTRAWVDEPLPGTEAAKPGTATEPPPAGGDDGAGADAPVAGAPVSGEPAGDLAAAWEPSFEDAGDARGQLDVDSPLLSRAFRPKTRPR